jgi:hypothetical protein
MKNSTEKLLQQIRAERSKLPPGNNNKTVTKKEMVPPNTFEIRILNPRVKKGVLPIRVSSL